MGPSASDSSVQKKEASRIKIGRTISKETHHPVTCQYNPIILFVLTSAADLGPSRWKNDLKGDPSSRDLPI